MTPSTAAILDGWPGVLFKLSVAALIALAISATVARVCTVAIEYQYSEMSSRLAEEWARAIAHPEQREEILPQLLELEMQRQHMKDLLNQQEPSGCSEYLCPTTGRRPRS